MNDERAAAAERAACAPSGKFFGGKAFCGKNPRFFFLQQEKTEFFSGGTLYTAISQPGVNQPGVNASAGRA